jgi:hypothetical protein
MELSTRLRKLSMLSGFPRFEANINPRSFLSNGCADSCAVVGQGRKRWQTYGLPCGSSASATSLARRSARCRLCPLANQCRPPSVRQARAVPSGNGGKGYLLPLDIRQERAWSQRSRCAANGGLTVYQGTARRLVSSRANRPKHTIPEPIHREAELCRRCH